MIQITIDERRDIHNPVVLGRRGENLVRQVIFDLTGIINLYGEGTFDWVYENPKNIAYSVSDQFRIDNYAVWTITDVDTANSGRGRAQLRFYPGTEQDDAYRTIVFATLVEESLGPLRTAPSPYDDIIEIIHEDRLAAEAAADDAEDAKEDAIDAKDDAEAASQAVQNMGAVSHSVASGQAPTVTKTVNPQTGVVTLDFGIPSGHAGEGAVVYNTTMSLSDADKARARGNIGIIDCTDADIDEIINS